MIETTDHSMVEAIASRAITAKVMHVQLHSLTLIRLIRDRRIVLINAFQ